MWWRASSQTIANAALCFAPMVWREQAAGHIEHPGCREHVLGTRWAPEQHCWARQWQWDLAPYPCDEGTVGLTSSQGTVSQDGKPNLDLSRALI